MSDIKRAIDILDDRVLFDNADDQWALEFALSVLKSVCAQRSEIEDLFISVQEKEHDMLATFYDPDEVDNRTVACREYEKAYAALKEQNLFIYYKLYDYALIVNGDADRILDMAVMNILPPQAYAGEE